MSPTVAEGATDSYGRRADPVQMAEFDPRAATATTTPRRPTTARSGRSTPASPNSGDAGSSLATGRDRTPWERVQRPRPPTGSPNPDSLYSWPEARFAVAHPRWEPYPRIGHVLCGGRSVMSVPAMTHLEHGSDASANKNSLVLRPGCSMLTTAVRC